MGNCGIILTSREKEPLHKVRKYMDTEIEIMGFDEQGVHEYAMKLLKEPEKCEKLMVAVEQCKLKDNAADYGILHIPIFLQMVCFLFKKGASVLRGKVAVLSAIIERCVNRESIRKTGTTPMKDVKQSLSNLGQLALHGLMADNFQQSFRKVSQSGYRHLI